MKILGYTDSRNECDCGKTNLKGVYVVETNNGDVLHLGSSCVKKNWNITQKEFTAKKNEAYNKRRTDRFDFMREAEDMFREVMNKFPSVNKYTPELEGYDEFMSALKNLKQTQIECDKKLPILKFN